MKKISMDQFIQEFKPLKNPFGDNASFDGCMLLTYGHELEYVKNQNLMHVWTLIDSDGVLFITSGFHVVNRMGYFITEHPCPNGEIIEVTDDATYRVVWEIDVEASSPTEAALAAMRLMPREDDDNQGKCFTVSRQNGTSKFFIDLCEEEDDVESIIDTSLPFGIEYSVNGGCASLTSLLSVQFTLDGELDEVGKATADAMESLLLAMVAEGIDIRRPKFARAITSAVEFVSNKLEG